MDYPKAFVDKAKKLYPNWTDLHRDLDEGSLSVGSYLHDASKGGIPPKEVVKAFEQGGGALVALKESAEQLVERKALYLEWCKLNKQVAKID